MDEQVEESRIDRMVRETYADLRRIAQSREGRGDPVLQPTAIVHEAYLRMRDGGEHHDEQHFIASAAIAMGRVIVDAARANGTLKRGGDRLRVTLSEVADAGEIEIDALDWAEAIDELTRRDERAARVCELRICGGLTNQQIAAEIEVSEPTVSRDWRYACAFLQQRFTL